MPPDESGSFPCARGGRARRAALARCVAAAGARLPGCAVRPEQRAAGAGRCGVFRAAEQLPVPGRCQRGQALERAIDLGLCRDAVAHAGSAARAAAGAGAASAPGARGAGGAAGRGRRCRLLHGPVPRGHGPDHAAQHAAHRLVRGARAGRLGPGRAPAAVRRPAPGGLVACAAGGAALAPGAGPAAGAAGGQRRGAGRRAAAGVPGLLRGDPQPARAALPCHAGQPRVLRRAGAGGGLGRGRRAAKAGGHRRAPGTACAAGRQAAAVRDRGGRDGAPPPTGASTAMPGRPRPSWPPCRARASSC